MYLTAKLRVTGSSTSHITWSSFFSLSLDLMLIVPAPISPCTENFIPSLVVEMLTIKHIYAIALLASLIWLNSLHILENSPEGIVTTDVYSVSGMPSYSESRDIKFKVNSETLSPSTNQIESLLLASNVNYNDVGSSSCVLRVMIYTNVKKWTYIIITGTLQNLTQVLDTQTHCEVAVASVLLESIFIQLERHKCNMWWIHRLQWDASTIHVQIDILDQLLDGINYLLEYHSLL